MDFSKILSFMNEYDLDSCNIFLSNGEKIENAIILDEQKDYISVQNLEGDHFLSKIHIVKFLFKKNSGKKAMANPH